MSTAKKQNSIILQLISEKFDSVLIIMVLVIFLFAYFFFISPKYETTIISIKSNIEQQERLYLSQKTRLESLKIAAGLYEEIKKSQLGDVRKVNAVLPTDYTKERLFGEFEEIVSKSGFLLSSVQIKKEDVAVASLDNRNSLGEPLPKGVGRIYVELSIGAIDYAGLKNLLATFEANNRLLDIESVSFSPSGKTASLGLYTYYFMPSL